MAKKTINVGATPNDRQGDSLRIAFTKINDNFTELYSTVSTYTPTTASSWNGTAPTTTDEAIDRLAALVKTLNNGTGA